MATIKVAQASITETVYKIRSGDTLLVLCMYETGKRDSTHNHVGYSLYDGTRTIASGESFRVPRGQKPTGQWAAMQLLGFLTDESIGSKLLYNEACDDISLMVYDYEESQEQSIVKA